MGYVCRKSSILGCLSALEAVLRQHGYRATPGAGVDAAYAVYREAGT
jgi:aspartate aminotransferase-like enzyme